MSFLEGLGKKISSASQEAIAKTKDFADITKLKSNIADEERRINAAYAEIGKAYVETHAEDYEESFAEQIAAIREAKTKIVELEQQIVDIKGVVICPKCGAEVPKDAAFCATCGSAIKQEPTAVTIETEAEETEAEETETEEAETEEGKEN